MKNAKTSTETTTTKKSTGKNGKGKNEVVESPATVETPVSGKPTKTTKKRKKASGATLAETSTVDLIEKATEQTTDEGVDTPLIFLVSQTGTNETISRASFDDAIVALTVNKTYAEKTARKLLAKGSVLDANGFYYCKDRESLIDRLAPAASNVQELAENVTVLTDALNSAVESETPELVIVPDEVEEMPDPEQIIEVEKFDEMPVADDVVDSDFVELPAAESNVVNGNFGESTALAKVEDVHEGEIVETAPDGFFDYTETELGDLSDKETKRLNELVHEVQQRLPEWNTSNAQMGILIAELKNGNAENGFKPLYRQTHKNFAKFVWDKFSISKSQALQLIVCGEVFNSLTDGGVNVNQLEILPSQRGAQTLAKNVRELLLINYSDLELRNYERAMTKFVWEVTISSAVVVDGKPVINPAHLESVKQKLARVMKEGVIEVDGQDVPLNLVDELVDASITEETLERRNRQKTAIVDDIKKTNERLNQPQERKKTTPAKTEPSEPKKVKPTLGITCSEHGEQSIKKLVFGGLVLTCDCAFIKVSGSDKMEFTDVVK